MPTFDQPKNKQKFDIFYFNLLLITVLCVALFIAGDRALSLAVVYQAAYIRLGVLLFRWVRVHGSSDSVK